MSITRPSSFSPASRIILIERQWNGRNVRLLDRSFSPASRIILIESNIESCCAIIYDWFQSRKQDYFNWKNLIRQGMRRTSKFQSRKQDYFNWKGIDVIAIPKVNKSFSPASRIILIESLPSETLMGRSFWSPFSWTSKNTSFQASLLQQIINN